MSLLEGPARQNLISRVQGMIMRPAQEWDVVEGESATVQGLFAGYVCILSAIIPIMSIIVGLFAISVVSAIGWYSPFARLGPTALIGGAVINYAQALVTTFAVGLVVDALAPSFDGQASRIQGMKVAAYAWTAAWVSGVALIVPFLGAIIILIAVIYSLYTFWIGAPKLMKVPAEKATGFSLVSLIAAIVVAIVIGLVLGAIKAMLFVGSMIGGGLL